MSATWTISVGGRSYGPYALEQMTAFKAEGRLAPHSMVAREGEEQFHHAGEDAELAQLFSGSAAAKSAPAHPAAQQADTSAGGARFGRDPRAGAAAGVRNRYIILSDMKSGSISALEEEILNFGLAYRFLPQAWILTSEVSLNTIRSELIQKLGKLDMLIVIDTSNDKAAWFNFGPEADTKMRRLWQREAALTRGTA